MSKLSGKKIIEEVASGNIFIDPFDLARIGPNSYDLRLGKQLVRYLLGDGTLAHDHLDVRQQNKCVTWDILERGEVLEPGTLYLASTMEVAGSNKYVPCIEGRSSLARLGMQVHMTAGFGDVGFIGNWTLEITVVHRLKVYPGMRICQVYFDTVEGDITLYEGKYKDARGVQASLMHLDK